ncbi:MAG: OmpW family outer membrane protein [Acidobacteriota bacterium]
MLASPMLSLPRLVGTFTITMMLLAGGYAAAEDWTLRGGAAWIDPSIDTAGIDFDSDGDLGFQASIERRFSPLLGVEIGALHGESSFSYESDVLTDVRFRQESEFDLTALTAGLNFHLKPGRNVDLYFGPLLAYIDFGDIQVTDQRLIDGVVDSELSTEGESTDEFAWGAQIGADIGFSDGPWGLNLSAKYLDSSFDVSPKNIQDAPSTEIEFDPWILGMGFSYRF